MRQLSKTRHPQEYHSTDSVNIAGDTEPDKPLYWKTLQIIDESVKIGPPEHSVESVQETNSVNKDKSTPNHFATDDDRDF